MFWNRKKPPDAMLSQPRKLHYTFAHKALREICAEDPLQLFSIMGSPERDKFLAWLCNRIAQRSGDTGDTLSAEDIEVTTLRVGNYPTILIKMPEPRAAAEAHFVGIVLTATLSEAEPDKTTTYRYFTLECGVNLDSAIRTVMCEWAGDGHRNYGDGPPATAEAFLQAVQDKV